MIALRRRDRLPIVATVQLLLNSHLPNLTAPLACDGIFGQKTEAAVVRFHRDVMRFPGRHAIVGPATWEALTKSHRLQVRDIVDTFDQPIGQQFVSVLRRADSSPIIWINVYAADFPPADKTDIADHLWWHVQCRCRDPGISLGVRCATRDVGDAANSGAWQPREPGCRIRNQRACHL